MDLGQTIKILGGYLERGGFVMPPLLLIMLVLGYALSYRWLVLRRGDRRSIRIQIERARAGRWKRARGIVDAAICRGLQLVSRRPPHLRKHLEEAFIEYEDRIRKYRRLIRTLVIAAPLLGLLGTVSGMIETFTSLGEGLFYSHSGGISGGISEAMYSTQFGLSVAIPGMILGRILDRREENISMELSRLKDLLTTEEACPA